MENTFALSAAASASSLDSLASSDVTFSFAVSNCSSCICCSPSSSARSISNCNNQSLERVQEDTHTSLKKCADNFIRPPTVWYDHMKWTDTRAYHGKHCTGRLGFSRGPGRLRTNWRITFKKGLQRPEKGQR